jgi:hypothetical protein
MRPRKVASVLVRAPVMRAAPLEGWAVSGSLKSEPAAGSFVHDMF